ncbi:hypothetical protein SprV_0100426900 [Sparganum proliferum]
MDKFQKLSSVPQDNNDVLVHKLSSKEFKPEQIQVLKHAAGFNISDADPVNLVATIESVLKHSQEPAETQHLIRQQITSLVMAHKPRLGHPKSAAGCPQGAEGGQEYRDPTGRQRAIDSYT